MIDQSEIMFLALCIPSRVALALAAKYYDHSAMVPAALIMGIQMLRLWVYPSLRTSGPETLGRPIWWGDLRIVHATLYLAFALASVMGNPHAWKFLAFDVIFGLFAFFFLKPRN